MEKQEKAYKGVIEYFKNRIMAASCVRGRSFLRSGRLRRCWKSAAIPFGKRWRIMDMTGSDFLPAGIGELHHL